MDTFRATVLTVAEVEDVAAVVAAAIVAAITVASQAT